MMFRCSVLFMITMILKITFLLPAFNYEVIYSRLYSGVMLRTLYIYGDIYRITKLNTRDNEGRRQQGEICLKKVKNKNDHGSFDHGSFEQTIEPEGTESLSNDVANLINEIDSRNQELQHKIKSKLKLYDEKMKHFDAFINELSSKINKMDKVLTQVVNIINGSSQLR